MTGMPYYLQQTVDIDIDTSSIRN